MGRDAIIEALGAAVLRAQLDGDRRAAVRLLVEDGLERGLTFLELTEALRAAQREVGRLWAENVIGIAEEHLATAIAHVGLSHLFHGAPAAPRNGKRIVLACVEGERHEFPARLAADALELAGFELRYLGADVPPRELIAYVASARPELVALSLTVDLHQEAAARTVQALRAALAGCAIAVGGRPLAADPSLAVRLGADATGTSAGELVTAARRLLLAPAPTAQGAT